MRWFNFTYYYESYDMTKDSSELHKSVLIRVNTPVLDENNNLEKQLLKIDSERIINPIYEEAFDLKK